MCVSVCVLDRGSCPLWASVLKAFHAPAPTVNILIKRERGDTDPVHLLLILHTHTLSHSSKVLPPSAPYPDSEITNDLCLTSFLKHSLACPPSLLLCSHPSIHTSTPHTCSPPLFSAWVVLRQKGWMLLERRVIIGSGRPGNLHHKGQKITDHLQAHARTHMRTLRRSQSPQFHSHPNLHPACPSSSHSSFM